MLLLLGALCLGPRAAARPDADRDAPGPPHGQDFATPSEADAACLLQLNHEDRAAGEDGDGADEEEDVLESTMQFMDENADMRSILQRSGLQAPKASCSTFDHRGSTHLSYEVPSGTKYWFSQVRLQDNPLSGVYWASTFNRGYTGVQYRTGQKGGDVNLLCSIWDDEQNGCTVQNKCDKHANKQGVKANCPGKYNDCDMFGSEGTGVKSAFRRALSTDETFSFAILRESDGPSRMHHQCYVHHPEFNDGKWYLMLDYHGPDTRYNGVLTKAGGFNEKFAPQSHEQGMKNEATYSGWTSGDGLTWQKQTSAILDPSSTLSGKNDWKLYGEVGTKTIDEKTGEQGFSLATCGCKKGHCCPKYTKCKGIGMRQNPGRKQFSVQKPERKPAALMQFITEVMDGGDAVPKTAEPTPKPSDDVDDLWPKLYDKQKCGADPRTKIQEPLQSVASRAECEEMAKAKGRRYYSYLGGVTTPKCLTSVSCDSPKTTSWDWAVFKKPENAATPKPTPEASGTDTAEPTPTPSDSRCEKQEAKIGELSDRLQGQKAECSAAVDALQKKFDAERALVKELEAKIAAMNEKIEADKEEEEETVEEKDEVDERCVKTEKKKCRGIKGKKERKVCMAGVEKVCTK